MVATRDDRDRIIVATEVRDDPALPTLSCRIELALPGGRTVVDTLIDGGRELAIDVSTIDDWALALWREAGRTEVQYRKFRAAVDGLEEGSAPALLTSLAP